MKNSKPKNQKFKTKIKPTEFETIEEFLSGLFTNFKLGKTDFSVKDLGQKIGINSRTELMMILRGKKKLSKKQILSVTKRLDLDSKEKKHFLTSEKIKTTVKQISTRKETYLAPPKFFSNIANVIILNLCGVHDGITPIELKNTVSQFISPLQISTAIDYLFELDLIALKKDRLIRTFDGALTTQGYLSSEESKNFNIEALNLMKKNLELEPTTRELQSFVLRIDKKDLARAKTIIRDCRQKLSALSKGNNSNSVYLTSLGLMPIYSSEKNGPEIENENRLQTPVEAD